MYLEHFGLNEAPFRITPHTDFFYDGADRGATLDALLYAIQHDEGIVKVSGEVGSGKTMLCRVLMERLPAHVVTIYLANPALSRDEILFAIAEELELDTREARLTAVMRTLQDYLIELYAAGRRVVILIDEAHAMPEDTLEQVRLLSNLETSRHKLLQIVLFGQPELEDMLATASMRQLRDRVTHSFRMRPLDEADVGPYLVFRLRAAGYRGPDLFTAGAIKLIARASGGLTRRINILADKSLLSAFSANSHTIDERPVRAAIADAELSPLAKPRRPIGLVIGLAAVTAGALIGAGLQWILTSSRPDPGPNPAVVAQGAVNPSNPSGAAAPVQTPAQAPVPATGQAPAPAAESTPVASTQQQAPAPSKASPAGAAAATTATIEPKEAPPPGLSRDQVRSLTAFKVGNQRLLGERVAATRQALELVPDDHYTLELYVTDNIDPARMERFLVRAQEQVPLANLYVIPIGGPRKHRIWVTYGAFPGREAAEAAAKALPVKYQRAFETIPRSFAELRSGI